MEIDLITKYNIPGPRYTSYPTVPYWNPASFDLSQWKTQLIKTFNKTNATEGISLYIHLPFCKQLCTFCGCHKRITQRQEVASPYIDSLLNEWAIYRELFTAIPLIKEIHLGGGTPTFFTPSQLERLILGLFKKAKKHPNFHFGFEAHPNTTSAAHLKTLYRLGFRRVSFGVQCYAPHVQKAINRKQTFTTVKSVTKAARAIGYTSISHDLVFGLPKQRLEDVQATIEKTKQLLPDRIAFYSYAHVPWIKGLGQRGFMEADLPSATEKRDLYQSGKAALEQLGYVEIGMDHFALPTDALYKAMKRKELHRNFMGYTEGKTALLVGLGMSAISDSWGAFAQNVKTVKDYSDAVDQGKFPIFRGHILSELDKIIRQHILHLMCRFETSWENPAMQFPELDTCLQSLTEFQKDGLLERWENGLKVTPKGRPFIRNICMAFDLYLHRSHPQKSLFSMTI